MRYLIHCFRKSLQAGSPLTNSACWPNLAEAGSFLDEFYARTAAMSPTERGCYLEHPPSDAPELDDAHEVTRSTTVMSPPKTHPGAKSVEYR